MGMKKLLSLKKGSRTTGHEVTLVKNQCKIVD